MPRSSFGSRSASSSESLTPSRSTYSKVTRRRLLERERAHRFEQARDVPLLVDRHQHVAHLVGGGVERDRQVQRSAVRVSAASFSMPGTRPAVETVMRRREKSAPVGSVRICERAHHVLVVVQRLAHAHEDEVGDAIGARAARRIVVAERADDVLRAIDLVDDLAGRELPPEAELRRRAEAAVERAADLRRHALGELGTLGKERVLRDARASRARRALVLVDDRRRAPTASPSGMSTVSIMRPSCVRSRSLRVPSLETCSASMASVPHLGRVGERARAAPCRGRSSPRRARRAARAPSGRSDRRDRARRRARPRTRASPRASDRAGPASCDC